MTNAYLGGPAEDAAEAQLMMQAADVARSLRKPERIAMGYYALENISPKARAKIDHPSNRGWSSRTIDSLLDKGLLRVGDGGWHVFTDLGRAVHAHVSKQWPRESRPHE